MNRRKIKFGILGAGPSGLLIAQHLKYKNLILEQKSHPGGLAGSFYDQGYTFDYGPHIIFSRDKEILDFMVKSLDKNIHTLKRNSKIYYKGVLMKYPFENDLAALPKKETYECLMSYIFNPYKQKYKNPINLEQWLLHHFGKSICEKYLFPYNKKVWNIPIRDLSMIWASRIPNPPPEDIVKSALGIPTDGYKHQLYFHYPLHGGYQAISEVWAKKADIVYNFPIKKIIKKPDNTFVVSDGKNEYCFTHLISTLPIHELIKIADFKIPAYIKRAAGQLIINPLLLISLGIEGEDEKQIATIYFPDKNFLINRVSFPKTLSPNNAPKKRYSLQAEITCKRESATWQLSDQTILNLTLDGLVSSGIIKNKTKIVYKKVTRIKYAYVVYDRNYEKNAAIIRYWFPRHGIHLVGRFSYFEYINTDAAVRRAKDIAEIINHENLYQN